MQAVRGVLGGGARIVTWSQINLERVNGLEWSLIDAIFKAIPESCKRCLNPAACSNCLFFQPFNFDGHYIYFKGFFPTSQRARERMREKEREREKD